MARLFQPGDGLGGYRIVRLLGAGGFAEVYEAVNPAGVHRALKVLGAEASRGSKIRTGLAREAEALARIEHVNVVRFYEAGIEEDHVYLVLEMVEGVTLGDKMGDPFALAPMEDTVRWVHQACEGVAEAHRAGVIHRDLKPANILVTPADVVKVIDFGIAKLRSWTSASNNEHLLGTALYMAPEQLQAQPADARADVYSMGVILYEALSGVHPLGLTDDTPTVFQVFQQHLVGEPRPLGEVAPEVQPALAALVQHALAKDPVRRVPSMRALADGLHDVLLEMARERRTAVRRIVSPGGDPADTTGPISSLPSIRRTLPPRSSYPEPPSLPPDLLGDEPSPLAVTATHEPDRSAFPPPAPEEGATSSRPPPTLTAPEPPSTAPPPADPDPAAADPSPPVAQDPPPVRPSLPRRSSAIPVVAESSRPFPLPLRGRRGALVVVAAVLAAIALGGLWSAHGPVQSVRSAGATGGPAVPAVDAGGSSGADGGRADPRAIVPE
jgi:serine/threonine protein kinase